MNQKLLNNLQVEEKTTLIANLAFVNSKKLMKLSLIGLTVLHSFFIELLAIN